MSVASLIPASFRSLSIRFKIAARLFVPVLVAAVFLPWYVPRLEVEVGRRALSDKAERLVAVTAAAVTDEASAQRALALLRADPDVATARLASGDARGPAPEAPGTWRVSAPVRRGALGRIEVACSDARLRTEALRTRRLMLGVSALLVLLGIAASWIIGSLIARPIASTARVLEAVAAGDLTGAVAVNGHHDEIGRMNAALARALENFRGAVRAIAENAETLATASEELSTVSQQMSLNAQDTSAQSTTVAGHSREVSQNVQSVATSMEEMEASIREISRNALEAAKVAEAAVAMAKETQATIARLGASSTEIGGVLKVISSIAAQTNLLALNATIEAAHAGDAGRGFAVVAGEVKDLAGQAAKATDEIDGKIRTIQADVASAVTAISQIGTIINRINEFQGMTANAVEEQTATTSEIGRTIASSAGASQEISRGIASAAKGAEQTLVAAGNTRGAADELSRMAHTLQERVRRFRY